MPYEQLNQSGFLFTRTGVAMNLLKGPAADGYAPPAAVIGSPEGLRSWSITVSVLPDNDDQVPKIGLLTRSEYLWQFWLASKAAGDAPFWLEDPKDGLFYLGSFVADDLDYEILCGEAYSTGLQVTQRRANDQESPVEEIP